MMIKAINMGTANGTATENKSTNQNIKKERAVVLGIASNTQVRPLRCASCFYWSV